VITKIDLRVRTDNQRAIELYQRKGFTIEGTIRKAIWIDGRYYDHYWMGLEL
jgi:RimJ/RimL family protein N-acetyltransferase